MEGHKRCCCLNLPALFLFTHVFQTMLTNLRQRKKNKYTGLKNNVQTGQKTNLNQMF